MPRPHRVRKINSPNEKMRLCLGFCRKMFLSSWTGHRVCDDCKRARAWHDGVALLTEFNGIQHSRMRKASD